MLGGKIILSESKDNYVFIIVDTPMFPKRYCAAKVSPGWVERTGICTDKYRTYHETQEDALEALIKRMEVTK